MTTYIRTLQNFALTPSYQHPYVFRTKRGPRNPDRFWYHPGPPKIQLLQTQWHLAFRGLFQALQVGRDGVQELVCTKLRCLIVLEMFWSILDSTNSEKL